MVDPLLDKSAVSALREALLPLATVITPNLPEAGVLLGSRAAETLKEMYRAAEKLRGLMHGDHDAVGPAEGRATCRALSPRICCTMATA